LKSPANFFHLRAAGLRKVVVLKSTSDRCGVLSK
jgi:hypothetical protein